MKYTLLGTAAIALMLTACGDKAATEKPVETDGAETIVDAPMQSKADADLTAAVETQPDEVKARYQYRNPKETIEFFEIMPGDTVAEALPGGGWYSKILLPYLGPEGQLIGIDYNIDMWQHFGGRLGSEEFRKTKETWAADWVEGAKEWQPGGAQLSAFTFGTVPEDVKGTVDSVLFIRALHNMARFEEQGPYLQQAAEDAYAMLKPGGVVGVVQHRAPESASDEWANGSNGYIKESRVIAAFEAAGFEFVDSSSINANPNDMPTEEDFVWRLPPTLATSTVREGDDEETIANKDGLRAGYEAIGETDRMTLKFKKP